MKSSGGTLGEERFLVETLRFAHCGWQKNDNKHWSNAFGLFVDRGLFIHLSPSLPYGMRHMHSKCVWVICRQRTSACLLRDILLYSDRKMASSVA
ncbi:hypothetical protein CEXT_794201 [Caerostris extrusa]|uniref:Uncharacterized protein n=1 Tax=Caerostris extrusa TaxID=172846 RepID=A0AAV4STT2_CAEEX|nr:hypothetical protein CEXT_794201 [Caerostris extrusa]